MYICEADIKTLLPANIPTIVGGDLNAKNQLWGCQHANNNGRDLHHTFNKLNITVHDPSQPAYYPEFFNHKRDVLDLFLTNFAAGLDMQVLNDLSSDHMPVLATLSVSIEPGIVNTRHMDWTKFTDILKSKKLDELPMESTDNIENAINIFTHDVYDTYTEATKETPGSRKFHTLPQEIRLLIKHRNWMRKRYERTLDPAFKAATNALNREIKMKALARYAKVWGDKLTTLCVEDNSLWKLTKSLKKEPVTSRPIHSQHELAFSPVEKAEALADEMVLNWVGIGPPTGDDNEVEIEPLGTC